MKSRRLTPLGIAIKKKLVDRQMTQTELACRIGASPKYINLILHGERSGEKYMPAISSLLGLSMKKEQDAGRKPIGE